MDDTPRLAALCAALLLLCLAAQFTLPAEADLPEGAAPPIRLAAAALPPNMPTVVPPAILASPIFAPRARMTTAGGDGGPAMYSPLGGASIAGTVTIRRRSAAIVRGIDGKVSHVGIGAVINGWRLAALDSGGATLLRGAERIHLDFGAASIAVAQEDDDSEKEDEE